LFDLDVVATGLHPPDSSIINCDNR
jgi:hypothetical protein